MSFDHVISLLISYRYLFLFPVAVVEGPIITIIAGFLCTLGYFNPFVIYVVVIVADLVGDVTYYAIGRYGGKGLIERRGRYFGITTNRVEQLERHFQHHAAKTLIVGKILHGFGAVILLAAGVAKVPFKKYVWYNLLPTIPKSLILLLIGIYFGKAYTQINGILNYTTIGTITIALMLIGGYFGLKRFTKRYEDNGLK